MHAHHRGLRQVSAGLHELCLLIARIVFVNCTWLMARHHTHTSSQSASSQKGASGPNISSTLGVGGANDISMLLELRRSKDESGVAGGLFREELWLVWLSANSSGNDAGTVSGSSGALAAGASSNAGNPSRTGQCGTGGGLGAGRPKAAAWACRS